MSFCPFSWLPCSKSSFAQQNKNCFLAVLRIIHDNIYTILNPCLNRLSLACSSASFTLWEWGATMAQLAETRFSTNRLSSKGKMSKGFKIAKCLKQHVFSYFLRIRGSRISKDVHAYQKTFTSFSRCFTEVSRPVHIRNSTKVQ